MRRLGRRNLRVSISPRNPSIAGAGVPFAWWDAADHAATWRSKVTSGGNLVAVSAGTLNASDANFNNKPSVSLTATQGYTSSLPAASWKFLHDGSGATVFVAQRLNATTASFPLWTETGSTNAGVIPMQWHGAGGTFFRISNVGGYWVNQSLATMYAIAGVFAFATSTAEVLAKIRGAAWTTCTRTGSPSAANPVRTLRVGFDGTQGPFVGEIAEIVIFNRYLTSDQRDAVYSYLATKYGW